MPGSSLPSFRKPPITEVVCGVAFAPLSELNIPHYGLFWQGVRDRYPATQHSMPLSVRPNEIVVDASTGAPLPRVWLIGQDKSDLIQLQSDCFFYNWRKLSEDQAYPRFPRIMATFRELYSALVEFLAREQIGTLAPVSLELTYVNHMPQGAGWNSVEEIGNVFRDYCARAASDRFLPIPTAFAWHAVYELPQTAGKLSAKMSQVTRITDKKPTLRLELTAKSTDVNIKGDGMWEWFELAHQWIVRGFADLTQPSAQHHIWERENVS